MPRGDLASLTCSSCPAYGMHRRSRTVNIPRPKTSGQVESGENHGFTSIDAARSSRRFCMRRTYAVPRAGPSFQPSSHHCENLHPRSARGSMNHERSSAAISDQLRDAAVDKFRRPVVEKSLANCWRRPAVRRPAAGVQLATRARPRLAVPCFTCDGAADLVD